MKRLTFLFFLTLTLVSCGTRSGHFKLEGRFLHLNQGELYVYSPDGAIQGIDTIKVETGRFAYEIPCERPGELVLVFPNFSEQSIFAESGGSVDVKADASHLKEMKVTGTKENKLMTQFREQIAQVSPPEETRLATQFIKDHPSSRVAVSLLRKYFLHSSSAKYAEGEKLAEMMLKEQPQNGTLINLKQALQLRSKMAVGSKLPAFTATDVKGQQVTEAELSKADLAVIVVWASWNFQSQDHLRAVQSAIDKDNTLKALGICIDARKSDCENTIKNCRITFPVVCDGELLESPLLKKFGLGGMPANVILKKGKVVERNLDRSQLGDYLAGKTK